MLHFDAEKHLYFWDKKPIPSVTKLLGQYIKVEIGGVRYLVDSTTGRTFPASDFDNPADIGKAIHKGCAFLAVGKELNWSALDERIVDPLMRFMEWMELLEFRPLHVEEPVASVKWWYAGTPDLIGTICGKRYVIDIKTGALGLVGPQTAAYKRAYQETTGYTGNLNRAALHLPKDGGKAKLKELTRTTDWHFFKACLTRHNYLEGGI